jgi:DNA-directed RNA polymerase specialized sigma24 family protein
VDTRSGPDRIADLDEQRHAMERAWTLLLLHYAEAYSKLSERDQRALELVEVDGLSYEKAGTLLRVRRSNMKMIMFRSRKRIRAHVLRAMVLEGEPVLRRAV